MNNKYQEALNILKELSEPPLMKEQYALNVLQELVDKEKPRTEQDILKDFEKLGYEVEVRSAFIILVDKRNGYEIRIWLNDKEYSIPVEYTSIGMSEHKLLHELFKCLGWI